MNGADRDLKKLLEAFVIESNAIEGITRMPTGAELEAFDRFMRLEKVSIEDLERYVAVIAPHAQLRQHPGMDVRVGGHYPPSGGVQVWIQLKELLEDIDAGLDAWHAHVRYETLHPFMDGNGRSGRALWAWQMGPFNLGLKFLHRFYYQTLQYSGR